MMLACRPVFSVVAVLVVFPLLNFVAHSRLGWEKSAGPCSGSVVAGGHATIENNIRHLIDL